MPLTIPSALIAEMNKIDSPHSIHELFEIQLSEASTTLRYNLGNESVVWDGSTWEPFSIRAGEASETSDGDLPVVSIDISNIGRLVQTRVEAATNGLVGDTMIVRAVHSNNLAETTPYVTLNYQILEVSCTPDWCTFKLGSENFFFMQFPRNILKRSVCRYTEFTGDFCKYAGASTSCDRKFNTCISYSNSSNFGGQPGIPGGGFEAST